MWQLPLLLLLLSSVPFFPPLFSPFPFFSFPFSFRLYFSISSFLHSPQGCQLYALSSSLSSSTPLSLSHCHHSFLLYFVLILNSLSSFSLSHFAISLSSHPTVNSHTYSTCHSFLSPSHPLSSSNTLISLTPHAISNVLSTPQHIPKPYLAKSDC